MMNPQELLEALADGQISPEAFRQAAALQVAPSFWAIESQDSPGTYQVRIIAADGPIQTLEMSREALEALRSRAKSWSIIGGSIEFVHGENRHSYPFEI